MTAASLLLEATYHGNAISVGHADEAELALLAGAVASAGVRDELELWSLVAIRDPAGRGTEVHALGWRTDLANTWITSPLTAVDLTASIVSTRSGHSYQLGTPDTPELNPELRGHLAYALRTWGFDDVDG